MLVKEERTIAPVELHVCRLPGIRKRKDGCFCTFNDFNTFPQLSFPSIPQISTSFSGRPCLSKTSIFLACEFSCKEKPPVYFVATYVMLCAVQDAQCNIEESP